MTNFRKPRQILSSCLAALILSFAMITMAQAEDKNIVGMWDTTNTPDLIFGIPPFVGLTHFDKHGQATAVTATGTLLGDWQRVARNTYALTLRGFLPPETLGPDSPGVRFTVENDMWFEPDTGILSGLFTTYISSLEGIPMGSFYGTNESLRLPAGNEGGEE